MTDDAAFWTRIAAKYAADPVADADAYERTLSRVAGLLKPDDRVLELGCGTGSTALRLAPLVAEYRATDFAPGMVEIARGKLAADPCPGLHFEVATVGSMVAGSGAAADAGAGWDVVLGFNWLHLVPDLPGTLRGVRRLLKPGGLFVTKTMCLGDMNRMLGLAIPVLRLFGKAPATVRRFTAGELQAAIAAAGFDIQAVERHGAKVKDTRVFIVAERPAGAGK